MGASQSGRFLRYFQYEGFTEDEQERSVLEGGIIPHQPRDVCDLRVAEEVEALISAGWLLERDRAHALADAAKRWDWITRDVP